MTPFSPLRMFFTVHSFDDLFSFFLLVAWSCISHRYFGRLGKHVELTAGNLKTLGWKK